MKKLYLAFFVLLCSASFVIFMMEEKEPHKTAQKSQEEKQSNSTLNEKIKDLALSNNLNDLISALLLTIEINSIPLALHEVQKISKDKPLQKYLLTKLQKQSEEDKDYYVYIKLKECEEISNKIVSILKKNPIKENIELLDTLPIKIKKDIEFKFILATTAKNYILSFDSQISCFKFYNKDILIICTEKSVYFYSLATKKSISALSIPKIVHINWTSKDTEIENNTFAMINDTGVVYILNMQKQDDIIKLDLNLTGKPTGIAYWDSNHLLIVDEKSLYLIRLFSVPFSSIYKEGSEDHKEIESKETDNENLDVDQMFANLQKQKFTTFVKENIFSNIYPMLKVNLADTGETILHTFIEKNNLAIEIYNNSKKEYYSKIISYLQKFIDLYFTLKDTSQYSEKSSAGVAFLITHRNAFKNAYIVHNESSVIVFRSKSKHEFMWPNVVISDAILDASGSILSAVAGDKIKIWELDNFEYSINAHQNKVSSDKEKPREVLWPPIDVNIEETLPDYKPLLSDKELEKKPAKLLKEKEKEEDEEEQDIAPDKTTTINQLDKYRPSITDFSGKGSASESEEALEVSADRLNQLRDYAGFIDTKHIFTQTKLQRSWLKIKKSEKVRVLTDTLKTAINTLEEYLSKKFTDGASKDSNIALSDNDKYHIYILSEQLQKLSHIIVQFLQEETDINAKTLLKKLPTKIRQDIELKFTLAENTKRIEKNFFYTQKAFPKFSNAGFFHIDRIGLVNKEGFFLYSQDANTLKIKERSTGIQAFDSQWDNSIALEATVSDQNIFFTQRTTQKTSQEQIKLSPIGTTLGVYILDNDRIGILGEVSVGQTIETQIPFKTRHALAFYIREQEKWSFNPILLPENMQIERASKKIDRRDGKSNILIDTVDQQKNPQNTIIFYYNDILNGNYQSKTLQSTLNTFFSKTELFEDEIFIRKTENGLAIQVLDTLANNTQEFRNIAVIKNPSDHTIITTDVRLDGKQLLILYNPALGVVNPMYLKIIDLDFQKTFERQVKHNNTWKSWLYRHKGKLALTGAVLGGWLYSKFKKQKQ